MDKQKFRKLIDKMTLLAPIIAIIITITTIGINEFIEWLLTLIMITGIWLVLWIIIKCVKRGVGGA